jgi:hypothetical protein
MDVCNRLDLESLGSQPIMPKKSAPDTALKDVNMQPDGLGNTRISTDYA